MLRTGSSLVKSLPPGIVNAANSHVDREMNLHSDDGIRLDGIVIDAAASPKRTARLSSGIDYAFNSITPRCVSRGGIAGFLVLQ